METNLEQKIQDDSFGAKHIGQVKKPSLHRVYIRKYGSSKAKIFTHVTSICVHCNLKISDFETY